MTVVTPKPGPNERASSGVVRVLDPKGPLSFDEQRERARLELHLALTRRGIAVDPGNFREREFFRGATYYEVSVEHDVLNDERRDDLTGAFELGQMSGRYARRLIAGELGAEFDAVKWRVELEDAQRNPWRGDAASWPETNDPHVAFVLAYAWKLGYKDGHDSVLEDRPLKRPPYGKPVTFENGTKS